MHKETYRPFCWLGQQLALLPFSLVEESQDYHLLGEGCIWYDPKESVHGQFLWVCVCRMKSFAFYMFIMFVVVGFIIGAQDSLRRIIFIASFHWLAGSAWIIISWRHDIVQN